MSSEEVQFLKVLENMTERWTLECIRTVNSCGAVYARHTMVKATPQKIVPLITRLNIPLLFLIFVPTIYLGCYTVSMPIFFNIEEA